ncbi:glycine-rich cell wall structural protein 1.0-like [Miscanthus floridulus]|uniref:glycine-rich cell wall structural protein 1.0-like n=1 Tax=Miscanthus floridulus TaxID=154761 RepID=UPI003459ADEF
MLQRWLVQEAGIQAQDADDDTGRLSELIALADVGLQAKEDDDAFFTQAVAAANEAEPTYYKQQAGQSNAVETSHSNRVKAKIWACGGAANDRGGARRSRGARCSARRDRLDGRRRRGEGGGGRRQGGARPAVEGARRGEAEAADGDKGEDGGGGRGGSALQPTNEEQREGTAARCGLGRGSGGGGVAWARPLEQQRRGQAEQQRRGQAWRGAGGRGAARCGQARRGLGAGARGRAPTARAGVGVAVERRWHGQGRLGRDGEEGLAGRYLGGSAPE